MTDKQEKVPSSEAKQPKADDSQTERALWHGYLLAGNDKLPIPSTACDSDGLSRPAYTNIKSAEYLDSPEVLAVKADVLIKLMGEAKSRMISSGAGISTSAGCYDYASNAKGSVVQAKKQRLTRPFIDSMKPTLSHRVCVALEKAGLVEHWLQQNHDGLAQKAGFPYDKINEVHGSWHDFKNPVVKMSGSLRDDLCKWMYEWEEKCDFVLALGTSFSGMNADRCATSCAERHMKRGEGHGICIVGIQKTPKDNIAALRVFAKLDDFMKIVMEKMKLTLDRKEYPSAAFAGWQKLRVSKIAAPLKK